VGAETLHFSCPQLHTSTQFICTVENNAPWREEISHAISPLMAALLKRLWIQFILLVKWLKQVRNTCRHAHVSLFFSQQTILNYPTQ